MTDIDMGELRGLVARLETLLGPVLPSPSPTAVDPNGYPTNVAPGELIESAWGNAVVDVVSNKLVKKTGDAMTGTLTTTAILQAGGDGSTVPGARLRQDGAMGSLMNVGAITSVSVNLGRAGAPGGVGGIFARFARGAGSTADSQVGSITIGSNGGSVLYNTTSDERLKVGAHAVDGSAALDKVDAIEPVLFHWASDPDGPESIGFLAQQLVLVAPEAVNVGSGAPGDDDFVPWGVDPGQLVPTLVAAVQALAARVVALEGAAA